MSSKQLESIMGRVVKATPAPALSVVAAAPAPVISEPVVEAAKPQPEAPKLQQVAAPQPKAAKAKGEGRVVEPKTIAEPAKAPAAEPERAIQAYVPVSVAKAINIRAAQEDATVRSIILQGLQAIGFEISDEQVRDRRR